MTRFAHTFACPWLLCAGGSGTIEGQINERMRSANFDTRSDGHLVLAKGPRND